MWPSKTDLMKQTKLKQVGQIKKNLAGMTLKMQQVVFLTQVYPQVKLEQYGHCRDKLAIECDDFRQYLQMIIRVYSMQLPFKG